jgi:hypothetical protein
MVRILIFVFAVWLLFTVFVTIFAASAQKNEVRNLPKWLWLIICLFVPFIGGLLYLTLGRPIGRPKQRFGRTKVVAPDDDPAFLRDLAEKLDAKEESADPDTTSPDAGDDKDGKESKDKDQGPDQDPENKEKP